MTVSDLLQRSSRLQRRARPRISRSSLLNQSNASLVPDAVSEVLPSFNVKVAGLTSIDVTIPGVDKAYGMNKLIDATGIKKDEILFMGDKIMPGGNDYPVEEMGVDCISVDRWEDTAYAIEGIVSVS